MARVDPAQFAEKWGRRLTAAGEDIRRGVEKVTEAPTVKAARKLDKMRANFLKAMDEGKVKAGFLRVDLQEWKDKMLTKGLPRLNQGVEGAKSKMEAFGTVLLPHIDAGIKKIEAMPDVSLEDSIARAGEWIRHMSKLKR